MHWNINIDQTNSPAPDPHLLLADPPDLLEPGNSFLDQKTSRRLLIHIGSCSFFAGLLLAAPFHREALNQVQSPWAKSERGLCPFLPPIFLL